MTKRHVLLTAIFITPVLLLAVLYWGISASLGKREEMRNKFPPVGAGANATAGANAIGEKLAGHAANASAVAPKSEPKPDHKPAPDAPAAAPKLVQPESLPQGFVLVVEDKSGKAGASSPIYLAGTLNNWNPRDPKYKLEAQSDMRWRLELKDLSKIGVEKLAFKFTRGDWKFEELKADLSPPANRTLAPIDVSNLKEGEMPRIELTVEAWGDMKPTGEDKKLAPAEGSLPRVAGGRLARLQVPGGAGGNLLNRDLLVWLPPGYDDAKNADKKYPVLYMHDGQNLFAKHAAVPDEWGMDESATVLCQKGEVHPFIVVGIPNTGVGRLSEYLHVPAIPNVDPQGDRHVAWLVSTVMPRVERSFRVETGPENTGVGGSSLGATISLHAAAIHPNKFGLLLAESLPLVTGDPAVWESDLAKVKTWPRRVFLGIGGKELGPDPKNNERNLAYLRAVQQLDKRLEAAGLGPSRRLLIVDHDATHTESAWAKRLPEALRFLFPPATDGTK